MAVEYSAPFVQTVAAGENVIFTSTDIACTRGYVLHRDNSGIVTLRGAATGNQNRARYRISFGGNLAIADGGTVGAVSLTMAIDGETVNTTRMIVTPAAVGDYFNVSMDTFVDVPRCCCVTIAIENTAGTPVDVQNANIIIDRTA